jgi:hypothetical protein
VNGAKSHAEEWFSPEAAGRDRNVARFAEIAIADDWPLVILQF